MEQLEPEVLDLDSRMADRLKVTLWWVKGTMNTYVTVTDFDNHEETVIDIPEGRKPHEVYYHAMAYMPRGV